MIDQVLVSAEVVWKMVAWGQDLSVCSCFSAPIHSLIEADIWNRLLVTPATNAVSVSLFSARCIKMLTMSWQYLNPLMVLHINKGSPTSSIDLVDVANNFFASNDHMKHMFGTEFKSFDQLCMSTNVVWWIAEQPDSCLKFHTIVAVYERNIAIRQTLLYRFCKAWRRSTWDRNVAEIYCCMLRY